MSATLRVKDFAENKNLFATSPPIINVSSRQHPVTIHFSRRTDSDYVTQAVKKAIKIHTRLPPGGILIFLTGQNEIAGVCRKLEARFGQKAIKEKTQMRGVNISVPEQDMTPGPFVATRHGKHCCCLNFNPTQLFSKLPLKLKISGSRTQQILRLMWTKTWN